MVETLKEKHFELKGASMVNLKPNGQILVVGGRTGNFKSEWRKHPRLVFWPFSDHRKLRDRKIPRHVEIIVFCRFIRHSLKERIQEMAKETGVKFLRLGQNIGEIHRLLGEWLPPIPAVLAPELVPASGQFPITTEIPPALGAGERKEKMEETKKRAGRGAVMEFIAENANFSAKSSLEIKRLYELALADGLETTLSSVKSAFYRKKGRVVAPTPAPSKTTKRTDSAKLLEDFIGMTELAAVAFKEILEENKNLSAEVAQLQQELGALKDVKKLLRRIKF